MYKRNFTSELELDDYIIENYGKESNIVKLVTPSYIEGIVGFHETENKIIYDYEKMVESLSHEYELEGIEDPDTSARAWIDYKVYCNFPNAPIIFYPTNEILDEYTFADESEESLLHAMPPEAVLGYDIHLKCWYTDNEFLDDDSIKKIEEYNQQENIEMPIEII